MSYQYTLYNLTISVPFPCPLLSPTVKGIVPDITVVEGVVPRRLENVQATGQGWEAAPGLYLYLGGRGSGRFLVEGGERITFERNPDADEALICAQIMASVMAAVLRQRELLVLHATVSLKQTGAVAFCGSSGSGKSTIQAALLKKGCKIVSDDITALGFGDDGYIVAHPGVPKMNLCEDAAIKLGHEIYSLPRNPLRRIKVVVPVEPEDIISYSAPLKEIYILNSHSGEDLIYRKLTGAEKFAALQECIYGPLFPEEHQGKFSLMSKVLHQTEIIRIERPIIGWSVNKLVNMILNY